MKHIQIVLLILLITAAPLSGFAFRLSPMVTSVGPKGDQTSQVFIVENNSAQKVAIKFQITTRSHDQQGKETRRPTKDFVIYPTQIALNGNDKRNVRVTYVGNPEIKEEIPYRFIATQLPVEFQKKKKGSKLEFLVEYVAALYAEPEDVFPKIQVKRTQALGGNQILLEVENQGNAHQIMKDAMVNLQMESTDQPLVIVRKSMETLLTDNILPRESRVYHLEVEKSVEKDKTLRAQIQFVESKK